MSMTAINPHLFMNAKKISMTGLPVTELTR